MANTIMIVILSPIAYIVLRGLAGMALSNLSERRALRRTREALKGTLALRTDKFQGEYVLPYHPIVNGKAITRDYDVARDNWL